MKPSRRERRALARANKNIEPQAVQPVAPQPSANSQSSRTLGILVLGISIGLILGFWLTPSRQAIEAAPLPRPNKAKDAQLTLGRLAELPESELADIDIALTNLLCSEELPGRGERPTRTCLKVLDRMTEAVRSETSRNYHRFAANPAEFDHSEEFYKVAMLNTVLGQDFGLRYNPKKIAAVSVENLNDQSFYEHADDVFLSGLLGASKMGTCSSMPVLLTAVGRRLGYPLKLVAAKGHLFFRWDDGKTWMNFECTNGISCYPDSHYRQWPFPIADSELDEGWYLRSLTPREELAIFFSLRGQVLNFHKRTPEAILAHAQASNLHPGHPDYLAGLALVAGLRNATASPAAQPASDRQRMLDSVHDLIYIQAVNAINAANAARLNPNYQPLPGHMPGTGIHPPYPTSYGFPHSPGTSPGWTPPYPNSGFPNNPPPNGIVPGSYYPHHNGFPR